MHMRRTIIPGCLAALGVTPDGELPGLLSQTTLERFEVLQTPGLWGHNPADNSYWLAAVGPAPPPAASRRFLEAIEEVIAGAERLVDIASLEPFASGEFAAAIRRGLTRAARPGHPLTVRVLYGRHRFVKQTDADFERTIRELTTDLPVDSELCLQACRMETSNDQRRPSWNHAKIVAADGRDAIVGGHNLWHDDYLAFAPVHDLSARFTGLAAREAHAFLDLLWTWVARERAEPSDIGSMTLSGWSRGRVEAGDVVASVPLPAGPPGPIQVLAAGRLGTGVLADARLANIGAAVAACAFRQARSTIRLSQMDFGFHWDGVNHWSEDVVAALADVLTAPDRCVKVCVVLSEAGAKTAAGGPYSFGTTIADIVAKMTAAIGDRTVTGSMHVAALRFSATGDRWQRDGQELKIINHAKLWMVDDCAFHIGSDNIYPHNLQEFGYVVESEALSSTVLADYWEPLWRHSARGAVAVAIGR
jgi:phosphatidylserine/phosphatidylglycerophosphate/cardiolipin synthase-like enzyme